MTCPHCETPMYFQESIETKKSPWGSTTEEIFEEYYCDGCGHTEPYEPDPLNN